MSVNISKVYLLNVPLEDDLKNTLYFASSSAQHTYFANNVGKTYTDVSYVSETKTFRCKDEIDTIRQYNYIMWQNTAYSNKWFYAFIKSMEFVSQGLTDIVYEVDPLQTYMFDIQVKPSFVEREHTNNDTVGNNTLPENVELGEYVKNSNVVTENIGGSTFWYAVGVSDIVGTLTKEPSSMINGLPNGLYYVFVDSVSVLHQIAKMYDKAGKANAIYTMFVLPKAVLNHEGANLYQSATWSYDINGSTGSFGCYVPISSSYIGVIEGSRNIIVPPNVGKSYEPRNNKLKTFPYRYFNITNNAGTTVTYHYEDFDGTPNFRLEAILDAGCSSKLYPTNYKGFRQDLNEGDMVYDYGINGGKYPTISWNSDSYTNWLTQNAVNIGMSAGTTAINTVTGLALGNAVGAGLTFLGSVANSVAEIYKASLMPDQVKGNTNVGDLDYTKNKNKFTVFHLSIKPQYAQIIDDYFDLFGYKTNRLKVPNVAHRQNWWYTKTINANITGNVPNDEMNKIKEAYNNGLTFWRNASNFLNYSVSNGIV